MDTKAYQLFADNSPVNRGKFNRAVVRWYRFARMGKAKATVKNYREIALTVIRLLHDVETVESLTPSELLRLAQRFTHYYPSRWNAIVQCLRWVTPNAKTLKRRALPLTRQPPPNQTQFAALLAECDKLPRSKARLIVDFLAHTGLRISSARKVTWQDVYEDRIEYIAKGGRRCAVPVIAGLRPVRERLRTIRDGDFVLPQESARLGIYKACRRAGIRRLSHHDFRHLFITRCIESGVDVPTVARWVGHRDGGALIGKRYFHLLDSHSKSMAARVAI